MSERILPQLNNKDLEQSPYRVEVNLVGIAALLREENMSEHDIGRLVINLRGNDRRSIFQRIFKINTLGEYSAEDHTVDLYTKTFWGFYCSRLISGFSRFPEIDQNVRNTVILEVLNEDLNLTLLHELKHALDYCNPLSSIQLVASRLPRWVNPYEKETNRFADKLYEDTRWKSLVIMRPKDL